MLWYVGTMIIIQTRERIEYLDKRHREATRKQLETPGGQVVADKAPATHPLMLSSCFQNATLPVIVARGTLSREVDNIQLSQTIRSSRNK